MDTLCSWGLEAAGETRFSPKGSLVRGKEAALPCCAHTEFTLWSNCVQSVNTMCSCV